MGQHVLLLSNDKRKNSPKSVLMSINVKLKNFLQQIETKLCLNILLNSFLQFFFLGKRDKSVTLQPLHKWVRIHPVSADISAFLPSE